MKHVPILNTAVETTLKNKLYKCGEIIWGALCYIWGMKYDFHYQYNYFFTDITFLSLFWTDKSEADTEGRGHIE